MLPLVETILVWYHIVSHSAIWLCDYTQWVPLVDFVTRADGSASDPNNLEPLELIYAGLTAMAFGTVAVSYGLAVLCNIGTVQGAAASSAIFHGMWTIHMLWRWKEWSAMMHPDASLMTPTFFLTSHIVWTLASTVLVFLCGNKISKTNGVKKGKQT